MLMSLELVLELASFELVLGSVSLELVNLKLVLQLVLELMMELMRFDMVLDLVILASFFCRAANQWSFCFEMYYF